MTEPATEPVATTDQDPQPTPSPAPAEPDLGEAGKKAIQAEREARKAAEKQAAELAAKVKEFEDARKTQEERDAEERAELERTNAENAAKVLRYEVAAKANLPLDAALRLKGTTEEELLADAEELKALIGGTPTPPPTDPAPQPVPGLGNPPASPINIPLKDQIAAAEAAGDLATAAALKAMQLSAGTSTT